MSPVSVMDHEVAALPRRDPLNNPLAPLPEIGKGGLTGACQKSVDSLNDFMRSDFVGSRFGFPTRGDISAFKKAEEAQAGAHSDQPSRESSPEEFLEIRVKLRKKKESQELGVCIATYQTEKPSYPNITWVQRKGLAGKTGNVRVGDMIVSVDGVEVRTCEDVRNAVLGKTGDLELRLRRRRDQAGPPPRGARRLGRHVDEEGVPY